MTTIGLTDAPIASIEHESLGLLDHVEALSEFIRHCETPITIACQGDWGSGKTSMMNMVREKLTSSWDGQQRIETRWFNTWQFAQFQMQDEITLSLLTSFLEDLGDSEAARIVGKLGKFAANTMGNVVKAAVDITTGGAGDLVKDAVDKATAQDNVSAIRRLRGDIQKAVDKLLTKQQASRLVIFIDDLDRLVPERAVEILEIIKLFLDVPHCVFVLAVDYHVVSRGLEQKFGVGMDDLKGKSFFDKIIQLPFNLPVAQYDIRRYMKTLFGGQFKFREDDTDLLVRLAEHSIGANPRSLKRLFNTLQLLNIVAKKKNILDADAIATGEERQRLLFAVLCLQLAYEPVYRMLLKEDQQLSTEYFDDLCDLEHLQNNPKQFEVTKKALMGRGELDEALIRLADFMRAFKDAAQLSSDQSEDADESLSQQEIELLRGFLSLSALTSATGGNPSFGLGAFRHKAAMLAFIERNLKPKYQTVLAKMGSEFKSNFKENYGEIGFDFRLGVFAFGLWVQWDDREQRLVAYLWEVEGADKKMIKSWFLGNNDAFPNIQFQHLKSHKYGIIESVPFGDEKTPDLEQTRLNDYFALVDRTLSKSLPLLEKIYGEKQPIVDRLIDFSDKIASRLISEFTESDGWRVENTLRNLSVGSKIIVRRVTWNDAFMICLEAPWESFARNLVLGVKKTQWKITHDKEIKEGFLARASALFPEDKPLADGMWLYYHWLPDSIRYFCTAKLPHPGCRFSFDTPEQEAQAIEQIIEQFTRFKCVLPELDNLAASASA